MISEILGEDWELIWRIPDHNTWSAWDLENQYTGKKIEVKQAASRQSWYTQKPSVPQFRIRERDHIYSGDSGGEVGEIIEFDEPIRVVDLYVFAWRSVTSRSDADHRDCSQWEFYVVPSEDSPKGQQFIGLTSLRETATPVDSNMSGQTVRDALI